mmetsp:Transcript_102499/g.235158  ORF Transcript_102499/g.235158 Transcript_102499/m.235158 type:complete len:205 (+) Transcript_102499:577-1191(+)
MSPTPSISPLLRLLPRMPRIWLCFGSRGRPRARWGIRRPTGRPQRIPTGEREALRSCPCCRRRTQGIRWVMMILSEPPSSIRWLGARILEKVPWPLERASIRPCRTENRRGLTRRPWIATSVTWRGRRRRRSRSGSSGSLIWGGVSSRSGTICSTSGSCQCRIRSFCDSRWTGTSAGGGRTEIATWLPRGPTIFPSWQRSRAPK